MISLFLSHVLFLTSQSSLKGRTEINTANLWGKLFELIESTDWERIKQLNKETKPILLSNCKEQISLYYKYEQSIQEKQKDLIKKNIIILITNSILLEIESIIKTENISIRSEKLKALFGELIAIQYPLKEHDFSLYKSLYSTIRKMYSSKDNSNILLHYLYQNSYYQKLKQNC